MLAVILVLVSQIAGADVTQRPTCVGGFDGPVFKGNCRTTRNTYEPVEFSTENAKVRLSKIYFIHRCKLYVAKVDNSKNFNFRELGKYVSRTVPEKERWMPADIKYVGFDLDRPALLQGQQVFDPSGGASLPKRLQYCQYVSASPVDGVTPQSGCENFSAKELSCETPGQKVRTLLMCRKNSTAPGCYLETQPKNRPTSEEGPAAVTGIRG